MEVVDHGEHGLLLTQLAIAEGLDVWEARALEAVGHVSYQVVLDAVRARIDRENAPVDLLSDVWLAELSRLLPELADRYPDLPRPLAVGETEAHLRLFEAVARLAQALAARAPIVFFVDDVSYPLWRARWPAPATWQEPIRPAREPRRFSIACWTRSTTKEIARAFARQRR